MSENLQAELEEKEGQLIIAARVGQNLLEDNGRLTEQLRDLEKAYEAKRSESEKLKAVILELESERDDYHSSLEQTRTDYITAREDFRKANQLLFEENTELRKNLAQAIEQHEIELDQQHQRLKEYESQKGEILLDQTLTEQSLQQLKREKQVLGQNLFSVSRSYKKLSLEVQDRNSFWEDQCHDQQELLLSQSRELARYKAIIEQLQMQLDQKTGNGLVESELMHSRESISSGMSLHDELSEMDEEADQLLGRSDVGFTLDPNESDSAGDDQYDTLRPSRTAGESSTLAKDSRNNERTGDAESTSQPASCQRCEEVEAQQKQMEMEMKATSNLLLLVIAEKLKLQQQIEAWQTDMAMVLESRIKSKLLEERQLSAKQHRRQKKSDISCCCRKIVAVCDNYFPGIGTMTSCS